MQAPTKSPITQKHANKIPHGVNCGEAHTANYKKCPYYLHVARPTAMTPTIITTKTHLLPQLVLPHPETYYTIHPSSSPLLDYASVTKAKLSIRSDRVISFFTDLITIISSDYSRAIMIALIKSLLHLLFVKNIRQKTTAFFTVTQTVSEKN